MTYRNLQQCVADLRQTGRLIECHEPLSAHLEVAEIQRRVFASGGPAILYTNVRNCRFPMLGNLFGSKERTNYIFRATLARVKRLIELKIDPLTALRHPGKYWSAPLDAWRMRPRKTRSAPVLANRIQLSDLPQLVCWPRDGGAFLTLPQVYSEDPDAPGLNRSNLGMYRVQISGGSYQPNREAGLHYQIHRGIGAHHTAAIRKGEKLRVNVFLGGAPSMTLAAVMPLPEGLSELGFAGALAGHRIPLSYVAGPLPVYAEADFCLTGTIDPVRLLPEGPFGDHLGYYSLAHPFPVLDVEAVYCRNNAILPFTVVGRPPQEDTLFGELIHEISGPVIPSLVHGVKAVHAVDAAGVHPLMLAIGSERYVPYETRRPRELLTQASALLGQGQMSLAKYLFIVADNDDPTLDIHNINAFFQHALRRVDWRRDLHFITRTTIDTLDYSGTALNEGSKLIVAAAGKPLRELPHELPSALHLPPGFTDIRVCFPGVVAVQGPAFGDATGKEDAVQRFCAALGELHPLNAFPLAVVVDDSEFAAASLPNWLWLTFTRSNPAVDVHGVGEFTADKHWGCRGTLVIDARQKPHHAPALHVDPAVSRRIDALAARGGPLAKFL